VHSLRGEKFCALMQVAPCDHVRAQLFLQDVSAVEPLACALAHPLKQSICGLQPRPTIVFEIGGSAAQLATLSGAI
jgi:hypothetical protein